MMTIRYGLFVEQVVSRRKKVKIITAPTYETFSYILKSIRFLESVIVITLTHNNADMLG